MTNLPSGNSIAEVAHLIGDAARANMLAALMGGRALTAGELARHAGVTAQTTSGHLAKMTEARLLAVEKQGRHRYYRLATADVAQAIHALMALAADGPPRYRPVGPRDAALRLARTCYDHMAGRLALALADSLVREGHVLLADGAGLVTERGEAFFSGLGIDVTGATQSRRPLCRTCLDWSERRPHIAGRLGAALLDSALERGWVVRQAESRALRLTRAGESGFAAAFRLPSDWRVEGVAQ
ncbi:ArsR/SmtB family transcription factor [Solirhodobacter olei]|uniref:ArsR/SmtB family transcription factor n=1 Tax=Solirhodobacter olei TaxID=2493082 RepID=UPI000FD6E125|nr:helix-turn-helix domain-containing protein [Solirhodobacter olei]